MRSQLGRRRRFRRVNRHMMLFSSNVERPAAAVTKSRPIFAAFYSVLARVAERGEIGRMRHRILAASHGRVLEIGVGTGENFKHYPPMATSVVLTEPDAAMISHMRRRIAGLSSVPRFTILRAQAERLPFANESFHTVVATLVLCSVDDVSAVLSEIMRVLEPGGHLLVFEHQLSPDKRIATWQRRLNRPWGFFAGGCRLDRATGASIEKAGFSAEEIETLDLKGTLPVVRHHLFGTYRKPARENASA
jgi:ubiquinone/menaquinone biosynthesis C-methylase UbiE